MTALKSNKKNWNIIFRKSRKKAAKTSFEGLLAQQHLLECLILTRSLEKNGAGIEPTTS